MITEADVKFEHGVEVRLHDYMGDDDAIIQAMLVSTQGLDAEEATASKGRINFLMKNHHGTPFEHNAMTFVVAAPIKVFREFHRHRIGFSYNEMSGRYRELPAKFYLPGPDRPLIQVGKPGHYEYVKGDHNQYVATCRHIREHSIASYMKYQLLLEAGVAKEVARDVLPVNLFSEMFVTCNVRSMMALLELRTNDLRAAVPSKPMYEIELVARKMETAFKALFPLTYEAFNENGRQAP